MKCGLEVCLERVGCAIVLAGGTCVREGGIAGILGTILLPLNYENPSYFHQNI